MRLSKIFWVLFDVLIVVSAIWFNVAKGPFNVDFTKGESVMGSWSLILFHYFYVWFNIGFFMLAYTLLYKTHKAIFVIGALLSVAIASSTYFIIFRSSRELLDFPIQIYSIVIWPDLLILLTKRIKWIFVSPIISVILIFLIPDGQGAYWIAEYLSDFADVFLWTPIIWGIGALTILSFRKDRTIADSDQ